MEMAARQIPFQREVPIQVKYKNQSLACAYKADFVCYNSILVELKAIEQLGNPEKAQVINYLNATKFTRALLFNFGSPSLEYQRMVLNHPRMAHQSFRLLIFNLKRICAHLRNLRVMILLFDIGNTHTHIGLASDRRILRQINVPTREWFGGNAKKSVAAICWHKKNRRRNFMQCRAARHAGGSQNSPAALEFERS